LKFKCITNSTYTKVGMEALRLAKKFEINKFSKSARNNCWNQIKYNEFEIFKDLVKLEEVLNCPLEKKGKN